MIQDLIINSKHIPYHMSPVSDETLDEGSGASRLILVIPESGEAPKDASQNGQREFRLEAIGYHTILYFCCYNSHFVVSTALPVKLTTSKTTFEYRLSGISEKYSANILK